MPDDNLAIADHTEYLQARGAATRRLETLVAWPLAFEQSAVLRSDWRLPIEDRVRAELMQVVDVLRESPLPYVLRDACQYKWPTCAALITEAKRRIDGGIGMVVLSGFPVADLSAEEAKALFWLLGTQLSRPVATKWNGTMVYDVLDTGKTFGYGVRGSATNGELPFHTDNAFGKALPDYVGLLCLETSGEGGLSRYGSLYSVHNILLRDQPALLQRLYEPVYFDRQAEHPTHAPKVLRAPVFAYDGRRLSVRLATRLVHSGYALLGLTMDSQLQEALACLEEILADKRHWIEFRLEAGDLQYLNNHWGAHFRSPFVDTSAQRRHLLRMWCREHGGPCYDG